MKTIADENLGQELAKVNKTLEAEERTVSMARSLLISMWAAIERKDEQIKRLAEEVDTLRDRMERGVLRTPGSEQG